MRKEEEKVEERWEGSEGGKVKGRKGGGMRREGGVMEDRRREERDQKEEI